MNFETIGKIILIFAIVLFVIGSLFYLAGRVGFKGLPGDIFYKKNEFSFYFPIVTCIVISIILTVIINLIFFFLRR
ncbi:DUF2905 domain-containing protein [Candidatus Oleimmundimicrobium sp.]|uniref:DUF2905 domain-containing protein n=1 Tax=Candidatus Oleimmundimicrobium sp. TaxID=3060597 RepID=UPI00272824FC|nr:DUF2905 domain-containing protein [Candidatus Oleimmundimicrobium sp.]MDO8886712.1 DUF2905 domain-containing protein [Candidatus Oleimmundimicrobium sp.]